MPLRHVVSRRALLLPVVATAAVLGAPPLWAQPATRLRNTGEIRGEVSYCRPQGVGDVTVYIPGKSFQARPDADGRFRLYWVPTGTHNLAVDIPGEDHTVEGVVVSTGRVTNVGVIEVCGDGDGDGFKENEDCDDHDPARNAVRTELCNGIDDDCDFQIDEPFPLVGQLCDGTDTDFCAEGVFVCDFFGTGVTCTDISGSNCEICNGDDDDCNGVIDDGCP